MLGAQTSDFNLFIGIFGNIFISLKELNATNAFYFNMSCFYGNDTRTKAIQEDLFSNISAVSPAEEFFEYEFIMKHLQIRKESFLKITSWTKLKLWIDLDL